LDFPGNDYPNEYNYVQSSFPNEVDAPDIDPDEGELILVAYNPDWIPPLMGAVDQLLQYAAWKGDHNAKILAVNRTSNLKYLLQNPVYVGEKDYPAPYWDSDEDVDDAMPADEQDWYGMVTNPSAPADELTFVENAVIWILTGFVALVLSPSLPVGAAAAMTFRTLASRFTLAFRRGDVIEQIRIIIDAKDYGKVDTSTVALDEVIEVDINGLDEADFHDIMLVVTNP
jgi:hypothetical protein